MRLKHKESQLCHRLGAKCFVKCSLPVLRRVTQGKALFISAWWILCVLQLLPAEQCLWEMLGRVSKRDKAFELQMKLPALISSLSEQVLLEVSRLEWRESGICAWMYGSDSQGRAAGFNQTFHKGGGLGVAKCSEWWALSAVHPKIPLLRLWISSLTSFPASTSP